MHTPNIRLVRVNSTLDVDGSVLEPLSLADAKNHLRIPFADDNSLIYDLISAARLECETINNRSFINTTWKLTMDFFPPYSARTISLLPPALVGPMSDRNYWLNLSDQSIQLPMPPLVSLTSLTYVDTAGTTQTLDTSPSAQKVTVSLGTPGQITPYFGKIFPITLPVLGAINLTYVAGYGATQASVPRNVVHAMRILTSHYYENRTASVGTPQQVYDLLQATYWGSYS